MKAARIERGLYQCAMCKGSFPNKKIILDHVVPVVDPLKGFTTWDDYLMRLFCDVDGFQVLCVTCSDAKTMIEDKIRANSSKNIDKDEEKD